MAVELLPMTNEKRKASVLSTLEAMQTWPHWSEIARGAEKEYKLSQEEFDRILPEFQRFMALLQAFPGLGMLSEKVDVLWHSLILNTARYREFCSLYIGRFVDHLPCSSYELYGFSGMSSICEEPPATCTDPWPAPPDPSPEPEPKPDDMHAIIEQGSSRFVAAYTTVFGVAPDVAVWPRVALVDAIAQ
jgi:hypothetical protein